MQYVVLPPGAAIVHHADAFGLIRSGRVDCSVLGAYEVATDGSFANWTPHADGRSDLGGIGGAMDLTQGAKRVWLTMFHTTSEGAPRLVEGCTLPVTGGRPASLVVTDLAVIAVNEAASSCWSMRPATASRRSGRSRAPRSPSRPRCGRCRCRGRLANLLK